MVVVQLHNLQEFDAFLAAHPKVVVDFWATWCGPCRTISPFFEKLSESTAGVAFASVDVDGAEDIAQKVGIRAMPTFIAYHSGNKFKESVGASQGALQGLIAATSAL